MQHQDFFCFFVFLKQFNGLLVAYFGGFHISPLMFDVVVSIFQPSPSKSHHPLQKAIKMEPMCLFQLGSKIF